MRNSFPGGDLPAETGPVPDGGRLAFKSLPGGGVPAGHGPDVDVGEESARVVGFVERVRASFPDVVISVDTWRAEVADRLRKAVAADVRVKPAEARSLLNQVGQQ